MDREAALSFVKLSEIDDALRLAERSQSGHRPGDGGEAVTPEAPVPLREMFEFSTQQRGCLVGSQSCRSACLMRWSSESGCSSSPARVNAAASFRRTSALVALVYLRRHDTLAQAAAGFGVAVGTAHAYTIAVIDLLADRSPGLLKVLRETDPEYALLNGTLAECDNVGDGQADYSRKRRRHGVNVQVVTSPTGQILWISPALPGRCHDLAAARTNRIIRICERQGVPILAGRAYTGAGPWLTNRRRRPPGGQLTPTERTVNRALATTPAPVERANARL